MLLLAVRDDASAGAGPLGLLIIVLLAVATVFLIRNMNGRLKRLPREFPDAEDADGDHRPGSPRA